MLTNIGLVNHAKKALSENWGYVWGTFGQILTTSLLKEKTIQYPSNVGIYEDFIMTHWLNKRSVDCVGLIKSYMWWNGQDPIYNPSTDVNANGMFELSSEKGEIKSLPEIPGLCLWRKGHIGVYIGGGQVIEARGTKEGVVQTPVTGEGANTWTHWLKCPYIGYNLDINKEIQTKLNKLGYTLKVDGIIGPLTINAIKHFQSNIGIPSTGLIGSETVRAIDAMITKVEEPKKKTYIEIIQEVSNGSVLEWINGIDTAVAAAKADGDLGSLEIFKHLPLLIEKIGNK
jgi:hypothetical protein